MYKRGIETHPCNQCCRSKVTGITYSDCVCVCVALGTLKAKHIRRITLPSVACPALTTFISLFIINGTIFLGWGVGWGGNY